MEGRLVGGRLVVVKRLKIDAALMPAAQYAIFDDVALFRTFHHPNLVAFLGVTLAPNVDLIFAAIQGPTLHALLHGPEARELSLRTKFRVIRGLCDGFAYLHERCVFHRRFSSYHVLLRSDYEPVICGFSMSSILKMIRGPKPQGQWLRWCSPEVAAAQCGEASLWVNSEKPDVYSFGMVCWELCSEIEPFGDIKGEQAVLQKIAQGEQPFGDKTFSSMVPDLLLPLLSACLSLSPGMRPSFAGCKSFLLWVLPQLPRLVGPLDEQSRCKLRKQVDMLRLAIQLTAAIDPLAGSQAIELKTRWEAALQQQADVVALAAMEIGVELPGAHVTAFNFDHLAQCGVSPAEMFELDDVVRESTFCPLKVTSDGWVAVDESDPTLSNIGMDFGQEVKAEVMRMLEARTPCRVKAGELYYDGSGVLVRRRSVVPMMSPKDLVLFLSNVTKAGSGSIIETGVGGTDAAAPPTSSSLDNGTASDAPSSPPSPPLSLFPASAVEALRTDGKQHMLEGNYTQAIACFTTAIQTHLLQPLNVQLDTPISSLYAHRSAAFMAAGQFQAALDDCLLAKMDTSAVAPSLVLRTADCYLRLGLLETAEQEYKAVTEDDVSDRLASLHRVRTIIRLAQMLIDRERYQEALKHVTEALSVAPLSDDLLVLQGRALLALDEHVLATRSADTVLQKNPSSLGAWWTRGMAAYEKGRLDVAVRCFSHLEPYQSRIAEQPHRPMAAALEIAGKACTIFTLSCRAIDKIDAGAHEEAVQLLDEALALGPKKTVLVCAQLHFGRGIALNRLERWEEARDALSEALSLEADFFEALVERAKSFEGLGDMEGSLADLVKAKSLHPSELEIASMNERAEDDQDFGGGGGGGGRLSPGSSSSLIPLEGRDYFPPRKDEQ